MASSLNKVMLVGNLTKDPELKFLPSGQAVCNIRLAMNRKWKQATGEWKEEATFIGVVVWGKGAEACGEHLRKGSQVLVEGRLQSRSWEGEGGKKNYAVEVVSERCQFLGGKGSPPSSSPEPDAGAQAAASDDDIPY